MSVDAGCRHLSFHFDHAITAIGPIMDKHRLTIADNTKNIFHTSLLTVINSSNDNSHINETDRFLNEHDSSNILFNLPNSCNLEERAENKCCYASIRYITYGWQCISSRFLCLFDLWYYWYTIMKRIIT